MKIPHCDKCGCRIDKDLYNITFQDGKKLMPPIIGEVCFQCFNAVIKQMQHFNVACNSEKVKEDNPKIIECDPNIIDLGNVNFIVDYIVSIDGLPYSPDEGQAILVSLVDSKYPSICEFTRGTWVELDRVVVGEYRILSKHSLNIIDFKDGVRHSTMPLNEGSYSFNNSINGISWLVLNGNLIQHDDVDLDEPLTRKTLCGFSRLVSPDSKAVERQRDIKVFTRKEACELLRIELPQLIKYLNELTIREEKCHKAYWEKEGDIFRFYLLDGRVASQFIRDKSPQAWVGRGAMQYIRESDLEILEAYILDLDMKKFKPENNVEKPKGHIFNSFTGETRKAE